MEVADILDDLNLSFSDNFSFKSIPGMDRRFAPSAIETKKTMPKTHSNTKPQEEEGEQEEE